MTSEPLLRTLPPACALAALGHLARGRLRYDRSWVGRTLRMADGRCFEVFRHLTVELADDELQAVEPAVLVVRFEFARLSQQANRLTSLLPIPLIAGFPGFRHKLWMVESESGFWQGVYEWADVAAAQAYQRSLVYRVMSRRARAGSLTAELLPATCLEDFLRERLE